MLRIVLDTNLLVSSMLVRAGLPAQAIDAWRERLYLLVTSPAIMAELEKTLASTRIRRKYSITNEDVAAIVALLAQEALIVPGAAEVSGKIPDDPDDEIVLAAADDSHADLIASGDKHLLALGTYHGIPIVTVREMLDIVRATGSTQ
jgi:putative PIN family toxin of toxin-antitoxin system